MPDIRLLPSGRLALEAGPSEQVQAFSPHEQAFRVDWREGLFLLAAKSDVGARTACMRFWSRLAAAYLTRLCHLQSPGPDIVIEPPLADELGAWVEASPPMVGGEYLDPALLARIWEALGHWVREAVRADGGVEAFLHRRAPRWNQVGRVTFHLAENKNDASRPFAFMASFTTGVGASGQVTHLPLRKALELYAGAGDKPALLKLLTPVQEAATRCDWVKDLVERGDIYRPMAWDVSRAYAMLRSAPLLEESGLTVRLPDWWKKRPRPGVKVVIGDIRKNSLGASGMLDFRVETALGGQRLSKAELKELLNGPAGLVQFKGQWVELDPRRLQEALDHWQGLEERARDGEISFIEGMRLLAGAPPDLGGRDGDDIQREWSEVVAGSAMRELLDRLRNPAGMAVGEAPGPLNGVLRPYQRDGFAWLRLLTGLGLGACLADDMGLGKTLQVLALLQELAADSSGPPSLLVLPASLLGNWRAEAQRFAPSLRLLFLHPAETGRAELEAIASRPERLRASCDVAITTYSMLGRLAWLGEHPWRLVILDEAQAIKNHATAQSKAARKLKARARIVMTGTPVENRLGDLWALFDFLNPGLLGTANRFKGFVKGMEEGREDRFGPLRRLVSPYILRRLKTDRSIIADLPDKTEATRHCFLSKEQARLYARVVDDMARTLETVEAMARRGLVLQTLMRLKQICNHPGQFSGDGDFSPERGGKFLQLRTLCEELAERQERVLVFTQFREIIPALEEQLEAVFGRPGLVLHGGVPVSRRKGLVDQFQQEDGPPFFVLSIKAGGTGLNLTAASQVIHFDRWWNPAVENQATDRAFRIGQKRNVLVHKFVTRGTIEERIDALISEKRELAEQLLSGAGEVRLTELPDQELLRLVRLDLNSATSA